MSDLSIPPSGHIPPPPPPSQGDDKHKLPMTKGDFNQLSQGLVPLLAAELIKGKE